MFILYTYTQTKRHNTRGKNGSSGTKLDGNEVSKANADTSAVARANRADQKDVKLREPLLENDSQCSSILEKPKRFCFQTDKVHFSSISEKNKRHVFQNGKGQFSSEVGALPSDAVQTSVMCMDYMRLIIASFHILVDLTTCL